MRKPAAVLTLVVGGVVAACAGRAQVAAPTTGRAPEPVAPVMMPVAEVKPPTARAVIAHLADSAIGMPIWRNARWGLLIVDATTGDTLYSHDADKLFMPASNQKLLTGAVAMQLLGPDYRWHTPVLLRGVKRGDEFRGDIVIVGRGDPSVSDSLRSDGAQSAFDPIADKLAARGIKRVVGDIISEGDAFTGATTGYGWEVDDLDEGYGAVVDELLFNEGLLRVTVRAGEKPGAPVRIERSPTSAYPPIWNEATTRALTDSGPRIQIAYDSIAAMLHVSGTLAIGDSTRTSASYRHPNDAYRAAVRERLEARGIRVITKVRPAVAPAPANKSAKVSATRLANAPVDTLVVLESAPLREVLPRMQKPSQNQIAEILFRTSGLVNSGVGSADSARAVAARTLASFGIGAEQVAYRDGSGMSRHDYVSPRALVRVLSVMQSAPWGDLWRKALPLAGVDGTIANRMKNTPAAGNANAKTGTVDKARSLSGYVNTADGRLVIFSMLCNSFTVPNREVERVQDLLVSTIAGLRLGEMSGR